MSIFIGTCIYKFVNGGDWEVLTVITIIGGLVYTGCMVYDWQQYDKKEKEGYYEGLVRSFATKAKRAEQKVANLECSLSNLNEQLSAARKDQKRAWDYVYSMGNQLAELRLDVSKSDPNPVSQEDE